MRIPPEVENALRVKPKRITCHFRKFRPIPGKKMELIKDDKGRVVKVINGITIDYGLIAYNNAQSPRKEYWMKKSIRFRDWFRRKIKWPLLSLLTGDART